MKVKSKSVFKIIGIIFCFTLVAALFYQFSYLLDIRNSIMGLSFYIIFVAVLSMICLIILTKKYKTTIKQYEAISSCRLFNRMQVFFYVACLISLLFYFATALFSEKPLSSYFLEALLSCGGLIAVTIILVLLMQHNKLGHLNRMTFFIVGLLICLTINILVACNILVTKWLYYLLNMFGTAFMFSSVYMLYDSLLKVIHYVEEKDFKHLGWLNFRNVLVAIIIASTIISILLVVFYFTNNGSIPNNPKLMNFFPTIFLVISLCFSLMEPLNSHYLDLLEQYINDNVDEDEKEMVRYNLQRRLVHSTRRVWVRFLIGLIRPFFPSKVKNKKVVNMKNGPVIFVSNHYEVYGPIVSILHLPFFFRTWIISNMLDEKLVSEQMKPGVDKVFRFLPKKIRNRIPQKCGKIFMTVLKELDPIPVYRNSPRDLIKTMNHSVKALMGGDSLLIFPEETDEYKNGDVDPFYTGFAHLGKMYYEKTGKCITFYPYYISKKEKTMTFGNGVTYDANNNSNDEKKRIADTLYQEMIDIKMKKK